MIKELSAARTQMMWAIYYFILVSSHAPVWWALGGLCISILYYILVVIGEQLAYLPRDKTYGSKAPEAKLKKEIPRVI